MFHSVGIIHLHLPCSRCEKLLLNGSFTPSQKPSNKKASRAILYSDPTTCGYHRVVQTAQKLLSNPIVSRNALHPLFTVHVTGAGKLQHHRNLNTLSIMSSTLIGRMCFFFAPSSSCAPFLWFSEYGKRSNEACT